MTSGQATRDEKGGWIVRSDPEHRPAFTVDLGKVRELTAFSAVGIEPNAINSNSDLRLSISSDGETGEEVYRGSPTDCRSGKGP